MARPPRRWGHALALVIFACGVATGAIVPSFGASRSLASAEPAVAAAAAPAALQPPPAEPSVQVRETERPSPSAIARRALDFTAFVRAGSVYGAGALLDRKGHVLTCRHVVRDLDRVTVAFADGSTFDARVVDRDADLDLALLEIAPGARGLPEPASIASVEPGDELFALGAPRKMAFSLARGMASYVGRPYGGAYYLQSDLPMNAGSSGGPVLNDRGQLIGIASFVLRDSEGLAFALPIDYAYRRFRASLDVPAAANDRAGAFERWLAGLTAIGGSATEHD